MAACATSLLIATTAAAAGAAAAPTKGRATITSTALPRAVHVSNISAVGGTLQLEGSIASKIPDEQGPCVMVPLRSGTLRVGTPKRTVCENVGAPGRVGLTSTYLDDDSLAELSVTHTAPATGHVTVGPVVLTYQECSDCGPDITRGGGWVWVFDGSSVVGPVVLQISATTGAVVNTVHLPVLFDRAVMAADADGLWFGPAVGAGWNGSKPAALYRLAPEASVPIAVDTPGFPLCWMVASGTTVWAGIGTRACVTERTVRFDGLNATPAFATADPIGITEVVGGRSGLWTVLASPRDERSQSIVVRVDPATGRESVVASSRTLTLNWGLSDGQAVSFDGSLYVLSLPYSTSGGFGRLFRITPG